MSNPSRHLVNVKYKCWASNSVHRQLKFYNSLPNYAEYTDISIPYSPLVPVLGPVHSHEGRLTMSATTSSDPTGSVETSELRQRLPNDPAIPQKAESSEAAQETVFQLNTEEEQSSKRDADKRTYGRTPDGTIFTVPIVRPEPCCEGRTTDAKSDP